jgi:hypothetical protein
VQPQTGGQPFFGQARAAAPPPAQPSLRRNPIQADGVRPSSAQIADKQESLANLLKQFRT